MRNFGFVLVLLAIALHGASSSLNAGSLRAPDLPHELRAAISSVAYVASFLIGCPGILLVLEMDKMLFGGRSMGHKTRMGIAFRKAMSLDLDDLQDGVKAIADEGVERRELTEDETLYSNTYLILGGIFVVLAIFAGATAINYS